MSEMLLVFGSRGEASFVGDDRGDVILRNASNCEGFERYSPVDPTRLEPGEDNYPSYGIGSVATSSLTDF